MSEEKNDIKNVEAGIPVCPDCGEPMITVSKYISKEQKYAWDSDKKMFVFLSEHYIEDVFGGIGLYCSNCNAELPDDLDFDIEQ